LFARNIDYIRKPPNNADPRLADVHQIVREKRPVAESVPVRLREIAIPNSRAPHTNLRHVGVCIEGIEFHVFHWSSDKTVGRFRRRLVVADAATFRCPVEGMNRKSKFLAEILRDTAAQRRTRGDAQAQLWQSR